MTELETRKAAEILLVEDNPGDVRLADEALHENKLLNRLHVVEDGLKAMDFLHRRGAYADAPVPDLILLDLNLPGKDGREVLAEIKDDPNLRVIPVVVLTSSKAETDILRSYDLHANCYISKPVDFDKFIEIVRQVSSFWFQIVRLPSDAAHGQ